MSKLIEYIEEHTDICVFNDIALDNRNPIDLLVAKVAVKGNPDAKVLGEIVANYMPTPFHTLNPFDGRPHSPGSIAFWLVEGDEELKADPDAAKKKMIPAIRFMGLVHYLELAKIDISVNEPLSKLSSFNRATLFTHGRISLQTDQTQQPALALHP